VTLSHCRRASARLARRAQLGFAIAGFIGVLAATAPIAGGAQAASFTWKPGYSLQNGDLCYGWSDHVFHCTSRWHRASDGTLVSDNPSWVPNGAVSSPASSAPKAAAAPASGSGISQWAHVPGHSAYKAHDFKGDPYSRYFGQCTWYAWTKHKALGILGNAKQWTSKAKAKGFQTGAVPEPGATVVFQSGVQGASKLGHVGYVEEVYNNGWFMISEMNFKFDGGGWGRVSYRYARIASGVSFIYQ
jgi:surface antigen